jgi:hypothetical protein
MESYINFGGQISPYPLPEGFNGRNRGKPAVGLCFSLCICLCMSFCPNQVQDMDLKVKRSVL